MYQIMRLSLILACLANLD